ncbi:MAG: OmpH family outer membrane protein [Nitrospinae bacterium]|nr:OmpH family outer membrane protein [Nitrospinota bacterium]
MFEVRRHGLCILIFPVLLAFAYAGHAESANAKYGVVNIQRVLQTSKGGRTARSLLEREKKRLQTTIQKRREDLAAIAKKVRELQLEIEQKSAIWRQEEKERKAFDLRSQKREFAREQDNLRRLVRESERDLQDRGRTATNTVLKEVRVIVEELGKQEGLDVIVDEASGGVLFFNPGVDLTERVIKLYDQKKK